MRLTCSFCLFIQISLLIVLAYSQQPEINDQYVTNTLFTSTNIPNELSTPENSATEVPANVIVVNPASDIPVTEPPQNDTREAEATNRPPETQTTRRNMVFVTQKPNCLVKIYTSVSSSIDSFISTPKINAVLKNIGVCIVNGIMEIITFYIPAPFIPLIASAAGMIIPFEPVVMLKQKLPMRNYRRALDSAVNSFLGTFDRFAVHDDDDPYMTRRFNRRFMGNSNEELSTKINRNYEH